MKLISRLVLSACVILAATVSISAQGFITPVALNGPQGAKPAPDSRGWTDPALNHNKLLQNSQAADGTYKLVGPYKVVGTQFLFGEHLKADMYSVEAKALNIYISYNTYNQEVEFYSTSNPDKSLVKEPGDVDSFTIQQNVELGITDNMKFVYGSHIGTSDKAYYQVLYTGSRFSVYKKYITDLNFAGNNYAQSELRQFDLNFEYYYVDNHKKGVKKIKANASAVIKEFKDVKDLSGDITNEEFISNKEAALKRAFALLNAAK